MDRKCIYFHSRDEFFKISVPEIVYVEADRNYSQITLINGLTAMVGMNLGKMEQFLACKFTGDTVEFVRIGKRFIINMKYVFRIRVLKQELVLSDQRSFFYSLTISKEALKNLKDVLISTITINKQ